MTVIAKNDSKTQRMLWVQALQAVRAHLQARGAHPARCMVLLPYAQLMGEAQRQWALLCPEGFAPRFETTRNWAQRLIGFMPQGLDYAQDQARDRFTGAALLEKAGLALQREMLLPALLDAAAQLAPLAAAVPPEARSAWLEQQRAVVGLAGEGSALRYEAAVARLALEWVAASHHATDVLFTPAVRAEVDAIVLLQGFQPDALATSLCAAWGEAALVLPLWRADSPPLPLGEGWSEGGSPHIARHPAQDAEDEAQRAAACVIAHVQAGRTPVALASTDRALVRRITALLQGAGIVPKDENGWTLSTTRAAAWVMTLLRAAAWDARSDAVLDWLKAVPALSAPDQGALERWLRRNTLQTWASAVQRLAEHPERQPQIAASAAQIEALRQPLAAARPLAAWLASLRQQLQASGQWTALLQDDAGARVLLELHLHEGLDEDLADVEGAARKLSLQDFTHWADQVLEATRFKPDWEGGEPAVVLLPLAQLLARPFVALVLPGCDEKRLQTAPEPPGAWTAAQRASLGLPTRASLELAQRAAWACALQAPQVDLLWRASEGGEPLLASPLVLALGPGTAAPDTRVPRAITPSPVARPQPLGAQLPLAQLSATAYTDLRQCPYRFYAQRLLGLQDQDELEAEVDKRDFGTWLHAVLQRFHQALLAAPTQDATTRTQMMDTAAEAAREQLGLSGSDFLPYASGWPQLRAGYLQWLDKHEAAGAQFAQAEVQASQGLALAHGSLELVGTLDRIDEATGEGGRSSPLVIDYKTESDSKTKARIADGAEDVQLAFYAALQADPNQPLRAAYVNVGERGETKTHEAQGVAALRDALLAGIRQDFDRITQGAPLPALGEGSVCDWCAVRGLCRKDFWA
ncbi:PD-(D/E)XK nuclease family protein [Diaphorobacter limosus]